MDGAASRTIRGSLAIRCAWLKALLAVQRHPERAVKLVEDRRADRLMPGGIACRATIIVVMMGAEPEQASGLPRGMGAAGIRPNVNTYHSQVSNSATRERPAKAAEVIQGMHGEGLKPDAMVCSARISAFREGEAVPACIGTSQGHAGFVEQRLREAQADRQGNGAHPRDAEGGLAV